MDELEKELQAILKKYNAKIGYDITFPKYKEYPDEVLLIIKLMAKYGMKVVLTLELKT